MEIEGRRRRAQLIQTWKTVRETRETKGRERETRERDEDRARKMGNGQERISRQYFPLGR